MIFIKRGGSMKKPNKFKYKRVRLYWQDIVSNPEWLTLSKANIISDCFCINFFCRLISSLHFLSSSGQPISSNILSLVILILLFFLQQIVGKL